MVIDNFDTIRNHLEFNNKNEFYYVQVIQRKKDKGNEHVRVRSGYRKIKSFYIYSKEEFDGLKDRIIELCKANNARAYINPNVRNAQEVALECIQKYAELVQNNNAFMGNNIWESCCGCTRARGYKALWIVDVDTKDEKVLDKILRIIHSCNRAEDFTEYIVPTANGYHIICNGFNTIQFRTALVVNNLDKVDIHKNNPTLLYYDDISSKQEQEPIQS